jgi:hypothetical protein
MHFKCVCVSHVIFVNVDDFLMNFPDTRERVVNVIDQRIAMCIHLGWL